MARGSRTTLDLVSLTLCILLMALQQEGGSAFVSINGQPKKLPRTLILAPNLSQRRLPNGGIVLSMGLRSFIGKRIRRRRDNDDDSNDDDIPGLGSEEMDTSFPTDTGVANEAGLGAPPTLPNQPEQFTPDNNPVDWDETPARPEIRPPVRMGENPTSKEINVFSLDRNESAQDRINRVKSGKMTDEEKAAFLTAALSTNGMRPPLKPPVSNAEQEARDRKSKASPFPGDPIYRSLAGGKSVESAAKFSNDLVDRVGLDMQKRKRDYLAQVTDPHRFDRFRTTNQQAPSEDMVTPSQPLPVDLGERLAAAANAQEVSRKAEEEKRRRQQEEEAARIAEVKRRAREQQVRRQEQMAAEYARKKQMEQSISAKEEAAMQRIQEEQQRERMRAQEDFWARKLAEERKARDRMVEEDVRQKEQQYLFDAMPPYPAPAPSTPPMRPLNTVNQTPPQATNPPPEINPTPAPIASEPSPNAFNPDESDLVQPKAQSMERANGAPPRPQSTFSSDDLNDVKNMNRAASSDLPRRKTKKDIVEDEQLRRLRALNSPLPNIPQNNGNSRGGGSPPTPSFEPQRPVGSSVGDRSSAFNNLLRNNLNDVRNPAAKTKELLDGYSGRRTEMPSPEPPTPPVQTSRPQGIPPPRPASPTPSASRVESSNPRDENDFVSRMFGGKPKNSNVQPKSSPPPPPPPPERKGPIRMQLPLGDEEDDEEEGIDSKANPGMSIAEAMKRTGEQGSVDQDERSKKWGVDMSKFM